MLGAIMAGERYSQITEHEVQRLEHEAPFANVKLRFVGPTSIGEARETGTIVARPARSMITASAASTQISDGLLQTSPARVTVNSGDGLDVRNFEVYESVSRLFEVHVRARSSSTDVDFESCIGAAARFVTTIGVDRVWSGVCSSIHQVGAETSGLSTYELTIVPTLWSATQRTNYRIFQDQSELEIALVLLNEWGIVPVLHLDAASYGKRRYRTQYAESDFAFISRLLEEAGIAYYFDTRGEDSKLVLADAPNRKEPSLELPFVSSPHQQLQIAHVTQVRTHRQVRSGLYSCSDVDHRRPADFPLSASAHGGAASESRLEQYQHRYGNFLWKGGASDTPYADDRGPARTDLQRGSALAQRHLEAHRGDARRIEFATTAHAVQPGDVIVIADHPRAELGKPILVTSATFSGEIPGDFHHECEGRFTDMDFRPPLATPKPRAQGVESATVTGPPGEEIHTDEFGRVRVHFHWDRLGRADETSSCWIPVSQPWAGAGFGALSLCRVGQEVVVDFFGGDPDRPVVVGRVFTMLTPPPYKLPDNKSVSGMRSETYPKPVGADNGAAVVERAAQMLSPSPLAGQRASAETMLQMSRRTGVTGPSEIDVGRNGSGVVLDDTSGNEQLCLQAERDLQTYAKHNIVGTVGANRYFNINGNDSTEIAGFHTTDIQQSQVTNVAGESVRTVIGDSNQSAQNHVVVSAQDCVSVAENGRHTIVSATQTTLIVGNSTIVMLPDAIVIDSKAVYIKPGKPFMHELARTGHTGKAVAAAQGGTPEQVASNDSPPGESNAVAPHEDASNQVQHAPTDVPNDPAPNETRV